MRAPQSDVPAENAASNVNRVMERQVIRRARHLCLRAEPHTDDAPCPAHMAEAARQLLSLPG